VHLPQDFVLSALPPLVACLRVAAANGLRRLFGVSSGFATWQRDTGCVGGDRIDFFISHAGADRAWAEWVAWQLDAAGYTVELDVCPTGPRAKVS
jgi:hypothetical protein